MKENNGAHISFPLANRRAHRVSSCTGDPHKSPRKLSMIVPISQMRKPRFRLLKGLAQGPLKKMTELARETLHTGPRTHVLHCSDPNPLSSILSVLNDEFYK